MMYRKLILLPLMLFWGTVFAQDAQDVLYLKDGSFIKGTLIEYIANEHVRFKSLEGKVYEFEASEVKKLQNGDGGKSSMQFKGNFSSRQNGYFNHTGLGTLLGLDQYGSPNGGFSLQTVNGYMWKEKFLFGGGTGLDFMSGKAFVPLFADLSYSVKKGDLSPFAAASGGYAFQIGEQNKYAYYNPVIDQKGGLMLGARIGIRNYTKQNLGWTLSMGYRYQVSSVTYDNWFWNGAENISHLVTEKTFMNRLDLKFGILFH